MAYLIVKKGFSNKPFVVAAGDSDQIVLSYCKLCEIHKNHAFLYCNGEHHLSRGCKGDYSYGTPAYRIESKEVEAAIVAYKGGE
ncbi:hypothetical protein KS4_16010 [Poriferisphaera corsica]|uniref:Uncharacterized protein n=1 Tax=Poriferisphaera corsica TaxID=2528020 RepID=A0A517YTI7_9BACT|nr:hypothetical protein KS4_16010 [Poriferisphaera corsica]